VYVTCSSIGSTMCFWLICYSNLKPHGECLACKHPRACAYMGGMYVLYSKFDPIQEIDPMLKVGTGFSFARL